MSGGQLNPFAFKYPAVLVAWFAALADRMGAVSSGGADAVSSFLRVLKSGERPKDGDALEIAFRAGVRDDFGRAMASMTSGWLPLQAVRRTKGAAK